MKLSVCLKRKKEHKNYKKAFGIIRIVLNLHPKSRDCTFIKNCESSSGVEHHLAKVGVVGSNPIFRSVFKNTNLIAVCNQDAEVVELVDTLDLKSNVH